MRPPPELSSPANPRVKAAARLHNHKDRRKTGLFIAEGFRQITRALAAGLKPRELFICPALAPASNPNSPSPTWADLHWNDHAPVFSVSASIMKKLAYRENPEPFLAIFEQRDWSLPLLERHLTQAAGKTSELWLVAVGTAKPGNLGAMARSADAAGATALIAADAVVDPYNPNAIHASTGAVFTLPILSLTTPAAIDFLTSRRVQIFAASPAAKIPYTTADFTKSTAIVIGAEDRGLDDRWLTAATPPQGRPITIPMQGRTADSLNASNAAAVLLFEALRQRSKSAL